MTVIENTSGAITASASETALATVTGAGVFVTRVDMGNMAGGDVIELRIYTKCRNGTDSERLIHGPVLYGPIAPDQKLADSIPIISTGDYRATLRQSAGTNRSYPWVIDSLGANPFEYTSGAQAATIGTEHTLATVTAAGSYVLRADINALTAGDVVELRIYAKARNATDTEKLLLGPAVYGPLVPDQKIVDSEPVIATGDFTATLKQTAGTGRTFPWVILSSGA